MAQSALRTLLEPWYTKQLRESQSGIGISDAALSESGGGSYRPDLYQYGGDTLMGALVPMQRRILSPETQSREFIGFDESGVPQYDIVQIPAQLGQPERGPGLVRRSVGMMRNMASDPAALLGGIGNAIQSQPRAAAAGGRYFDEASGRLTEFDPLTAFVGGAPAGISAAARALPGEVILGSFGSAMKEYPELRRIAPYLSEEEKDLFTNPQWKKQAESTISAYQALPPAREMASVALAGGAKRGWYQDSYNAIQDIFQNSMAPDDPERFTALLAALSPQTSVESNLKNALSVWANWTAAGRPTDQNKILEIMGRSVEGDKGEQSVLGAWRNNSYRALQAPDARLMLGTVGLSGPKVQSFMRNLAGDFNEVTNDAWMAKLSSINQGLFSGANRASFADDLGSIGVKGPGYLAQNAKQRQAAEMLGWQPAEVQETAWSFGKTLSDLSSQPNYVIRTMESAGANVPDMYRGLQTQTAESALRGGYLTDQAIGATPAFGDLVKLDPYASLLTGAGYKIPETISTPRNFTSPYDRIGVGPDELNKTIQGRDLLMASRRLDKVQRRTDAQSALDMAMALKKNARAAGDIRSAAQRMAQAKRMMQRSVSELPNIPLDPEYRNFAEW